MSYNDWYAAVFYTTTVTIITLAVVVLARAYLTRRRGAVPSSPTITAWIGITILLLGLKQGVWMTRMMVIAAGYAPMSHMTDEASLAGFILSIGITISGAIAIAVSAYVTGGKPMLTTVGGCFAALCGLAVVVGRI